MQMQLYAFSHDIIATVEAVAKIRARKKSRPISHTPVLKFSLEAYWVHRLYKFYIWHIKSTSLMIQLSQVSFMNSSPHPKSCCLLSLPSIATRLSNTSSLSKGCRSGACSCFRVRETPSILPNLCPLFRGRLKDDPVQGAFQIQLNVFEHYMFWFAYYPVCKGNWCGFNGTVVRKSRGFRLESWTSSFPVLRSAICLPGQKTDYNLYLRLLYAYLCSFVPNYGLNSCQPHRGSLLHYSSANDSSTPSQAEFLPDIP